MNRKGFTLIELVLVIAILGILAISALPKFLNLAQDAEQSSRDGVVGAIRAGIALSRAQSMMDPTVGGAGVYPAELDALADAKGCDTGVGCFGDVMQTAVKDASWSKTDDSTYVFNDGQYTYTFTYDSNVDTGGTFLCTASTDPDGC